MRSSNSGRIHARTASACVVAAAAAAAALTLGSIANAAGPSHTGGSGKPERAALPALIGAPAHVVGGQQAVVTARVGQNAACRLTLSAHHHTFAGSAYGAAASGDLEWVWKVPRGVRSGTSTATVSCSGSRHRASTRISARGRRHGHLKLAHHIKVVPIRATETPAISGLGGSAYPPYGSVLVPAGDWFGSHGINVYSNGYGDNDNGRYQCVDLVTRFVAAEHFGPTIWGNANQLYADAPSSYYIHHPNGSGYIPVPGDIITLAGGPYGHVVIVDTVSGGQINVVEQNASPTGRSTLEVNRANGYISGEYGLGVIGTLHAKANTNPPGSSSSPPPPTSTTSLPPTSAPTWVAPAGSSPKAYQVYGTGNDGLYERTGPGTGYSNPGWLPNGASIVIACQLQTSSTVGGSPIWDLLTNGYFVADYYVNTPDVGHFSPGIAQCVHPGTTTTTTTTGTTPPPPPPSWHAPAGSTPQTYHVYGTGSDGLYEHTGPGTGYSKVGVLPNGTTIHIACQTQSSSSVNGSPIWDLLTTGYFVSDYYVDTPDVGKFSPGIAQCVYTS